MTRRLPLKPACADTKIGCHFEVFVAIVDEKAIGGKAHHPVQQDVVDVGVWLAVPYLATDNDCIEQPIQVVLFPEILVPLGNIVA